MPRKLQFAVTLLTFAACAVISLATTVKVLWLGIPLSTPKNANSLPGDATPDPDRIRSDANSLRGTLTAEDVAAWPEERQRKLLAQLERYVSERDQQILAIDTLEPPQRDLIEKNLVQLARVWLLWKAEQYVALDEKQRPAYLDALLEPLSRRSAMAGGQKQPAAAVLPPWLDRQQLAAHVDRLRSQLTPAELFRIGAFLSALRERAQKKMTR